MKKLQEAFIFPWADGSLRPESHATTSRRKSAQGVTPSQEERRVADTSEADRDAMEAREDF